MILPIKSWRTNKKLHTRITDRKIQCGYIHVYQITKNWGPGPYLHHADNRKYFLCPSLTQNWSEAHFLLGEGRGKNLDIFLLRKGNFIMINEFRYVQTWKIWLSPLSLSLYSTFKVYDVINCLNMSLITYVARYLEKEERYDIKTL